MDTSIQSWGDEDSAAKPPNGKARKKSNKPLKVPPAPEVQSHSAEKRQAGGRKGKLLLPSGAVGMKPSQANARGPNDGFTEQYSDQYLRHMNDIKEKFPEFRSLENNELELVLKLYDEHMNTPFKICNPAYYVSGALILLSSFMFFNAQKVQNPKIENLGLLASEAPGPTSVPPNSPQKIIMMTIMASSVCGLGYIALRNFFNSIAVSSQFGCYYICNAMLSGAVSVSAGC